MREILFRGKRIDNGEWVESSFIMIDKKQELLSHEAELFNSDKWRAVDPETVGQYTGLTDKNGNKIFEGDIVKEKDCVYNGEVQIYGNKWAIYFEDGVFLGYWKNCGATFFIKSLGDIEIIGNIHDNPELLEVEE